MLSHLGWFAYLFLINVASSALYLHLADLPVDQIDIKQQRILLSYMIVLYLSMCGCFAVVFTMMVMFIKHN